MSENQLLSPVKEMPDCWRDDKRMNVLFSPFRKRDLNPVDYDSKMKFWNNIIVQWCLENNQCIFTLSTLRAAFKRKGRTPSCLLTVVEELVRTGDLKNKNDFIRMTIPQATWTGWAVDSVKSPFIWSFSKLKEALSDIDSEEVQYVYLRYLKIKGEMLTSAENLKEKQVYTVDEIRKLIEPPECTIETAELILHWLKLEGKTCTISCADCELIKLGTGYSGPLQITDRDVAQFKLVKSKEALVRSLSSLEEEKEKALTEAKEYLSKGLKMAAKSSLRKKKIFEECIIKRVSTLENLDILLSRIRDAQSDTEVFDSYKIGLSALKSIFKEAEMNEDNVLDTINNLQEVNEMQDEIQDLLANQLQPKTDNELEEELSSILSNVKLDDELNLPAVPVLSPIENVTKQKKIESVKFPSTAQ